MPRTVRGRDGMAHRALITGKCGLGGSRGERPVAWGHALVLGAQHPGGVVGIGWHAAVTEAEQAAARLLVRAAISAEDIGDGEGHPEVFGEGSGDRLRPGNAWLG